MALIVIVPIIVVLTVLPKFIAFSLTRRNFLINLVLALAISSLALAVIGEVFKLITPWIAKQFGLTSIHYQTSFIKLVTHVWYNFLAGLTATALTGLSRRFGTRFWVVFMSCGCDLGHRWMAVCLASI